MKILIIMCLTINFYRKIRQILMFINKKNMLKIFNFKNNRIIFSKYVYNYN